MRPITSERYPLAGPCISADTQVNGSRGTLILLPLVRWPGSRQSLAHVRVALRESHPPLHYPGHAARAARRAARADAEPPLVLALQHPRVVRRARSGRPGRAGRDPIALLGEVPPEHLAALAADADYLARLTEQRATWRSTCPGRAGISAARRSSTGAPPAAIAYFSPEYGIASALPQYSGGLGILAGDHLKAASDLGVPLIGVGLLYRHGYFSQSLSPRAGSWSTTRGPTRTACR